MRKKLLIILAVVMIFGVATGCRGKRNVSVVISHQDQWTANISVGGTIATAAGNSTYTYDIGDTDSIVGVTATKQNSGTQSMTVQIIESYEAGFIYMASTDIKETATSTEPNAMVSALYDFSPE
ncbi:MAG: hypothetical protein LLG37_10270 [Spirochaetia bacterium]|nr:hypothetical protein [Spirochaetia bacterium]